MTPAMPVMLTRFLSHALPILFYLLALVALRVHLSTGDGPMLLVALLAGLAGIGSGVALVIYHRAGLGRLSSNG